jgi:hypothetical protein
MIRERERERERALHILTVEDRETRDNAEAKKSHRNRIIDIKDWTVL